MIIFKEGVTLQGVRPEISLAMNVFDSIMGKYGLDAHITSVVGFKHSKQSKHYFGCAFDGRSRNLREDQKDDVWHALRNALTNEYTVLLEDRGEENEHFHIQFGKKGRVLEWLNPKQLKEISDGKTRP